MHNLSLQTAEQFFRVLQMYAASLDDEKAMEVAYIYDPWKVGRHYTAGDFLTYGVNTVGDPQLYKVVQDHTAQVDWIPNITQALYEAIGLDDAGYPVWSCPTGAHDAYAEGDIVNHNGTLYISKINENTTIPGTDERWWGIYK